MKKLLKLMCTAALGVAGLVAVNAHGQSYPTSIKLTVGSPPGGANDVMARIVAEHLGKQLGTTFVVDTAPGAGGLIAQNKVVAAPADGSVMLLGSVNDVLTDVISKNNKIESALSPIGTIASVPFVLVGRPTLPATMDELARMTRQGTRLTIGGAGAGTYAHVAAELIRRDLNANLVYVPYKGSSNALTDLIGGHLDLAMMGLPTAMPHLKSGTMRIYGVFSTRRNPLAPDLPTLVESDALKSMKPFSEPWVGLLVPAKVPHELQAKLAAALNKVAASEEMQLQIRKAGGAPVLMTPQEMQRTIKSDIAVFSAIVKAADIRAE